MARSSAGQAPRGSYRGRAARFAQLAAGLCLAWLSVLTPAEVAAKEQAAARVARSASSAAPARPRPAGVPRPAPARAPAAKGAPAADVAAKAAPAKRTSAQPPRGPRSWRAYTKLGWRRGYVTLHSPGVDRRWTGYVLGPGDALLPRAEQQVRRLLASWRTGQSRGIDRRLIRLIARVSDVFGGRPIRVVSGFRERSHAKRSHHRMGEALDFSIDGVPNWALRDYLRTLDDTGVGYYPNSSFVHVDVRGYSAYWVDLSRPGAPPRYVASTRRSERSRTD